MSDAIALEQRLATVEREVAELKKQVQQPRPPERWYEKMIGSMKEYPEFEELTRLGREIRKSQYTP